MIEQESGQMGWNSAGSRVYELQRVGEPTFFYKESQVMVELRDKQMIYGNNKPYMGRPVQRQDDNILNEEK